jgi:hypothetical protein
MLIERFDALRDAGAGVRLLTKKPPPGFDAVLDITLDGEKRRFVVEAKARAPYPSEVPRLTSTRSATDAVPLLVAPYVSPSVGRALTQQGWSWIDEAGNYDIKAPRIRLTQRLSTSKPPRRSSISLPQGGGSWGVIRFLVSHGEVPLRASHLANMVKISQPRASQILAQLVRLDLAKRTSDGWAPHREPLLDAFLADYPGPAGRELHYYTLEPLLTAAVEITKSNRIGAYVSADVAADLIAPWRQPTHLIVYGKRQLRIPERLAIRAKGRHDANIIVVVPDDPSVVCPIGHEVATSGVDIRLAEHTQIIWDLLRLGGDDRHVAVDEVKKWLLRDPYKQ